MNDWVPCYRALMRGRKRALPRATRFIFLELCSEAREGGGMIELAPGLSLGEAVLDLIGGNRKEVHQAVGSLVAEGMVDAESQRGFLVITNWDRWKLKDITNAERQARWRERKRNAKSNGARNDASNANVTASDVTPPSPDQIREDQKREEIRARLSAPLHEATLTEANIKTTDADFDAELARAAEVAERKKRELADASPPVPLSTAFLKNDSKKASGA